MSQKSGSGSMAIVKSMASYIGVSTMLLVFNKYLLSESDFIDTPIFITFCQTAIAAVVSQFMRWSRGSSSASLTTRFLSLSPVTLAFTANIAMANVALTFLEIWTYAVIRAFTMLTNILVPMYFGSERFPQKFMIPVVLNLTGVTIALYMDYVDSMLGYVVAVAICFLSVLAQSVQFALTKKMVHGSSGDPLDQSAVSPWELSFFNNLCAALVLIPVFFITGEYNNLAESWLDDPLLWILLVVSSFAGIFLGMFFINATEHNHSLNLTASGSLRAIVISAMLLKAYGEHRSWVYWLGLAISGLGGLLHWAVVIKDGA